MVKLTKTTKKSLLVKKPKKDKVARKSFDFKEFSNSFKSLDSKNPGVWPLPVKITLLLFMMGVIGALAYALPISQKIDEIHAAEGEEKTLLEQYKVKESKARHLKEYQDQIAQMTQDFTVLLNQLPKDTRIPDLVDGINTVGTLSHIRFSDIAVEPEVTQEFFIEQPLRITAVGDYHQFGAFVSGLAKLDRIITMHDFEVNNSKPTLDQMPDLNLTLRAKTYRAKATAANSIAKGNPASAPAATEVKK